MMGNGRLIGLHISRARVGERVRAHPRITLIEGDACQSFEQVSQLIAEEESVTVIEDSSHTYDNTLNVLRTYAGLFMPGHYFIVEDSICHHGLALGPQPGPYEAIEALVDVESDFEIDRRRKSFLITWNPRGYLRRRTRRDERGLSRRSRDPGGRRTGGDCRRGASCGFSSPHIVFELTRALRDLRQGR